MSEHYFSTKPNSQTHAQTITGVIGKSTLTLVTDNGVFSKNRIDYGSQVLVNTFVNHVVIQDKQCVLELGSGYGPMAISLALHYPMAMVEGVELNERAVDLARQNAQRNRVDNVVFYQDDATTWQSQGHYHYVLTNPPIRAGKAVIQQFVQRAKDHLRENGELWLVIQKKQGAPSMERFMQEQFGNVECVERDKGYWILKSVK